MLFLLKMFFELWPFLIIKSGFSLKSESYYSVASMNTMEKSSAFTRSLSNSEKWHPFFPNRNLSYPIIYNTAMLCPTLPLRLPFLLPCTKIMVIISVDPHTNTHSANPANPGVPQGINRKYIMCIMIIKMITAMTRHHTVIIVLLYAYTYSQGVWGRLPTMTTPLFVAAVFDFLSLAQTHTPGSTCSSSTWIHTYHQSATIP